MIFAKKKILVWCDDLPEDRMISIFAGCLTNHDRTHSLHVSHTLGSIKYSILRNIVKSHTKATLRLCQVLFFKDTSGILQSTCYCCKIQRLLNIMCELIN
jgi:hypothetical protein